MPLQQYSQSPRTRHPEVPLPVSLTLYNLYVPNDTNSQNKNAFFRPEYTRDLLVPVRLDVIFSSNNNNNEDDHEIILYSSTNNNNKTAIHPTWDHLEERIEALYEVGGRNDIYQNCMCNIVASLTNNQNQEEQVVLEQVPLHPSRLRRLPKESFTNDTDDKNNNNFAVAWEQKPVPRQLPPNAILIRYADGSTRVTPPLYHLLVQQNVVVETDPRDASLIQDEEEEHKRQLRFDDDVFDTLDQVVWWQETTSSSSESKNQRPSPSSLLETDDESKAVVIKSLSNEDVDEVMSQEFATALVLSSGESKDAADLTALAQHDNEKAKKSFLPIEVESVVADLRREKEELEMLLAQEEACLEDELAALHKDEVALKELMKRVQKVEDETKLMRADTVDAKHKQKELDFCLEAQRIKLLEELQMTYPIRCQAEETWFIRGQEVPKDLHAGGVSEEEVSAALGFLCHSVVMISKYLSIALRYRIVCNSSRSAVQQDATTILPLFQARMVERGELNRGMLLVERNVACILKTRGIPYSQDSHILCKVKRIYDNIVDGR